MFFQYHSGYWFLAQVDPVVISLMIVYSVHLSSLIDYLIPGEESML